MRVELTFSNGSTRSALFVLQSYFLERHQTVCQATLAFEHCGVCPFPKLIQLCVGFNLAKPYL